jgi:hypothetical protein
VANRVGEFAFYWMGTVIVDLYSMGGIFLAVATVNYYWIFYLWDSGIGY